MQRLETGANEGRVEPSERDEMMKREWTYASVNAKGQRAVVASF